MRKHLNNKPAVTRNRKTTREKLIKAVGSILSKNGLTIELETIRETVNLKQQAERRKTAAAKFSGCSTPYTGRALPLPPPCKAIHRSAMSQGGEK